MRVHRDILDMGGRATDHSVDVKMHQKCRYVNSPLHAGHHMRVPRDISDISSCATNHNVDVKM